MSVVNANHTNRVHQRCVILHRLPNVQTQVIARYNERVVETSRIQCFAIRLDVVGGVLAFVPNANILVRQVVNIAGTLYPKSREACASDKVLQLMRFYCIRL